MAQHSDPRSRSSPFDIPCATPVVSARPSIVPPYSSPLSPPPTFPNLNDDLYDQLHLEASDHIRITARNIYTTDAHMQQLQASLVSNTEDPPLHMDKHFVLPHNRSLQQDNFQIPADHLSHHHLNQSPPSISQHLPTAPSSAPAPVPAPIPASLPVDINNTTNSLSFSAHPDLHTLHPTHRTVSPPPNSSPLIPNRAALQIPPAPTPTSTPTTNSKKRKYRQYCKLDDPYENAPDRQVLESFLGSAPQDVVDELYNRYVDDATESAKNKKLILREFLKRDNRDQKGSPSAISSRREAKVSRKFQEECSRAISGKLKNLVAEKVILITFLFKLLDEGVSPENAQILEKLRTRSQ